MKDADFTKVDQYMRMFDRILLYNLAVHTLPEEILQGAIHLWEKAIKIGINKDSSYQTEVLESTVIGRRAKLGNMPDGEKVRLDSIKQYRIAKDIIESNLQPPKDEEDFEQYD